MIYTELDVVFEDTVRQHEEAAAGDRLVILLIGLSIVFLIVGNSRFWLL
jgi:hypothetical protein